MNEEKFTPINEEIKIKPAIINFPETKKEETEKSPEKITNLPTWSIEPPIEIKRGN